MKRAALPLIYLASWTLACGGDATPESTVKTQRAELQANNGIGLNGIGLNGIGLNGIGLNGIGLNGIGLNGIGLNGIGLNGIGLNGIGLNGIGLNGTELSAVSGQSPVRGLDFIGAEMTGTAADGTTVALRVDDIDHDGGEDLYYYSVSYRQSSGAWAPLCRSAAGAPETALPLAGLWNYEEGVPGGGAHIDAPGFFTFACRGYALAKCVEFGYKPWVTKRGQPLADHHQACTRMLRADYCGDGSPHTVDGIVIDLFDSLGIQRKTGHFTQDAEWAADGAVCVHPWWESNEPELLELIESGARRVPTSCAWKVDYRGKCGKASRPNGASLLTDRLVSLGGG